jgi:hypothetical protein
MLAAGACASDSDELFSPLGPLPPEGAADMLEIAPPTTTAADPSQPSAPEGTSAELGPAGALPVDPATSSPRAEGAPNAPQPAPAPVVDVNPARACPAVEQPLLLDFSQVDGGPSQALFGDFSQQLSGGTFVYPASSGGVVGVVDDVGIAGGAGDAGAPSTPLPPSTPITLGLTSDVTAGDWHVSGRVVEPAGFGIFFNCQLLDASRFGGVAFRVRGQVGPGDIAVGNLIRLRVRTAGNDASREWFIATGASAPATFGRCTPELDQYDGTCEPANADVVVTPAGSEVTVRFADLARGRPEASVNPAEITQIEWQLPPFDVVDAGAFQSYDVDLHIDDIRFVP